MDGDSTQQPNKPVLCANNCGFFGNPLTSNFCSKCYRDKQQKAPSSSLDTSSLSALTSSSSSSSSFATFNLPSAAPTPKPDITLDPTPLPPTSISPAVSASVEPSEDGEGSKKIQQDTTRCWSCNKKVGLLGFRCRCEYVYCGLHRYSDKHDCPFDYKTLGRTQLTKANPVIKGSKLDKI